MKNGVQYCSDFIFSTIDNDKKDARFAFESIKRERACDTQMSGRLFRVAVDDGCYQGITHFIIPQLTNQNKIFQRSMHSE